MISFLRKRRKFIASFLLLTMMQNLVSVPSLFALSTGPEQPEFSSFESSGSSDMVNLITGDFTYNLPLIQIPGPEGNYTLPLFYHAGITPEMDASWCGLGFNVNAGSISRTIVGYPDDAYDAAQSVQVTDPGGSGYVKNYVVYRRTWDSQRGYGGAITLADVVGAEWNNKSGLTSGTVMGLNFNKSGVNGHWTENVMNFGQAVMTVASFGANSAAKTGVVDVAMSAVQMGGALYQGYQNQGTFSSKHFNWNRESDVSHLGFRVDYKYWLDDTRVERGFGSLYLGSMDKSVLPTLDASQGTQLPRIFNESNPSLVGDKVRRFRGTYTHNHFAGSDMYSYVGPNQNYGTHINSTHISYDQYSVMSDGISGSISPYRMEIGSLAQPSKLSLRNETHNLVPFIEEDTHSNKVQFYYPGQFSNKYTHHDDSNFGITTKVVPHDNKTFMQYKIESNKLKKDNTERVEADAERINGKKLVSGKNIEWFSGAEITNGTARGQGFIDTENVRNVYNSKSIGGFMITKEDGVTYHYALPVYRHSEIELTGKKNEEETKYSRSVNSNPVPITWLLTAITGPDYVDNGQVGLIDDQDWGYYVKFSYGKTTYDYEYRNPYQGYIDDGKTLSFSVGVRDQFYLNSIETRSHKAVFIKGVRTDGLSSYYKKIADTYGHNTETGLATPTPALYLDEILLFSKAGFNSLYSTGRLKENNNVSYGFEGMDYKNGNLREIFDDKDISEENRKYVESAIVRRVKFIYETDPTKKLCKRALNSISNPGNPPPLDTPDIYANKGGKLTLKRLKFFGQNSEKLFPDYKFDYAYNPDYNINHWDGWGMFNPNGTNSSSSHQPSQVDLHGTAWSLTNIVLPTGAEIKIDYSRDSYSTVSGEKIYNYSNAFYSSFSGIPNDNSFREIKITNPSQFKAGDEVKIEGTVSYTCSNTDGIFDASIGGDYTVESVTSESIIVDYPIFSTMECNSGASASAYYSGVVYRADKDRKGGNIRVNTISFLNELGSVSKTKYSYLNNDNSSSGVVAKEPEFSRSLLNTDNYGINDIYDFPFTPVLYSKVTVHTGYNQLTDSYNAKQVYEFEVPTKNLVTENRTTIEDGRIPGFKAEENIPITSEVYMRHYLHRLSIRNSRIGKIKSIRTLDANNKEVESYNFQYTETPPGDQGKFTTGSILSEFTAHTNPIFAPHSFRLLRTSKTYIPYVLEKITHKKDGYTDTKKYISFDLLTGSPSITDTQSPDGVKIREESIPASKVYSEMGARGKSVYNKNMLSQTAAHYLYKLDDADNIAGLISAKATTWKNNWDNYRVYNARGVEYDDGVEGPNVWRKYENWSWLGHYSRFRSDGLQNFSDSDKFHKVNASASTGSTANGKNLVVAPILDGGWKKVSEIRRYDHFSMPLEVVNVVTAPSISHSVKMGYNHQLKLATASNAAYHEMYFSGAEDSTPDGPYFGGEVIGSARVKQAHTGDHGVIIGGARAGSTFNVKLKGITNNRQYRASVWANSPNAAFFFTTNGTDTHVLNPEVSSPVKLLDGSTWYRHDVIFPLMPLFSVGVTSLNNAEIVVDDFRFQPVQSDMTCYVYGNNSEVEYILDNDNVFTRYEYNDRGEVVRMYRESIQYGEKLVSESSKDFKRNHVEH
jgi:hypothetical protein